MTSAAHLVLVRKLRELTKRVLELELADYDRQIRDAERYARDAVQDGSKIVRQQPGSANQNEVIVMRVMQAAGVPLGPREIRERLGNVSKATASRWLASAVRRGYVQRVVRGQYVVAKEVPPL